MSSKNVLVTGGCGFIGSCFIRMLHARDPEAQIVNLDLLTYAGNLENLSELEGSSRYSWVQGDVRDESQVESLMDGVDQLVNFAAESHVDRSTAAKAGAFVETNVYGTFVLLDAMRRLAPGARFLQIGTDEVYGDVDFPRMPTEESILQPSSPYSASKAGADHVALSFSRTHDLDVMVSRCTNNYGGFQYPEKMIPLFVTNALDSLRLPLYDGGTQIRDWLRVEDHCEALLLLLEKGESGEIYNVGANQDPERTNLEVTEMILAATGAPDSLIEHRHGLRPGHDQRYAVSTEKIRDLGWRPQQNIEQGIEETVGWYAERRDWWEPIKSGAYREFYESHYGKQDS